MIIANSLNTFQYIKEHSKKLLLILSVLFLTLFIKETSFNVSLFL